LLFEKLGPKAEREECVKQPEGAQVVPALEV
jgi:hypothetical protein